MGKQICEEVLPYSCETKLCMSPTMMIRRVARNSQWGDVRGGGGAGGGAPSVQKLCIFLQK